MVCFTVVQIAYVPITTYASVPVPPYRIYHALSLCITCPRPWHDTAWQVQLLLQEGVENIDNSELANLRCFERFDSE